MEYAENYKINFYLSKFERDHHFNGSSRSLDYTFVHGFPIGITAMPVSYDQSQVLKCNISFSFIRYVMQRSGTSNVSVTRNSNAPAVKELGKFDIGNDPRFEIPVTEFNTSKIGRTITNEYYNNGIIRGLTPNQQRQGPGQRQQDATNFTRDIA